MPRELQVTGPRLVTLVALHPLEKEKAEPVGMYRKKSLLLGSRPRGFRKEVHQLPVEASGRREPVSQAVENEKLGSERDHTVT